MTEPRSERSAWLLVGSTPRWSEKVQSAGQSLSRLRAIPRVCPVAGLPAGVGAQDRLELAPQRADAATQLGAVAGVLVDLPAPEQLLTDLEAGLAEGLLGSESLGMGFEVASQVRPADLASFHEQVRVGPPTIGGDDRAGVGEQLAGMVLVTVGADA